MAKARGLSAQRTITLHRVLVVSPLFGRKEAQRRSAQYVRGLLVQQTDRRNAENVAETIVGGTPRALQRLLTEAPWPTAPVIDRLQAYAGARLNTPEGVWLPYQGAKERFSPIDAKDFLDGTRRLDDDADFGAPKRAPGRHFIVGHAVQRDLLTRSHPLRDIHAHPP
jgi:DDE superfamily endonuclease